MRTDTTICLNYYKDNGDKRSLQDRIYHTGGVALTITTCFHYNILEIVYEDIQDISISERSE